MHAITDGPLTTITLPELNVPRFSSAAYCYIFILMLCSRLLQRQYADQSHRRISICRSDSQVSQRGTIDWLRLRTRVVAVQCETGRSEVAGLKRVADADSLVQWIRQLTWVAVESDPDKPAE